MHPAQHMCCVACTFRCWARSQMLYTAGSNPNNQSFIVGYNGGSHVPDRPAHRGASCNPNFATPCDYGISGYANPVSAQLLSALQLQSACLTAAVLLCLVCILHMPCQAVTHTCAMLVWLQGPNPSILYGAMVGGPNNQDWFDNSRADYTLNEVALDYNSGGCCCHHLCAYYAHMGVLCKAAHVCTLLAHPATMLCMCRLHRSARLSH